MNNKTFDIVDSHRIRCVNDRDITKAMIGKTGTRGKKKKKIEQSKKNKLTLARIFHRLDLHVVHKYQIVWHQEDSRYRLHHMTC
jgi:hypothetical protein